MDIACPDEVTARAYAEIRVDLLWVGRTSRNLFLSEAFWGQHIAASGSPYTVASTSAMDELVE